MVVQLRDVGESDLPTIFENQKDPLANHMAAFTAKDPADWAAFHDHWTRILADNRIVKQCITLNQDLVVGHVSSFEQFGEQEVSYWIDRAATDNIASRRVLEKCGFVITGEGSGFANARQEDTKEFIYPVLKAP